jgi:RNA polymerase sigma-70 factor (ECF subfamily)
MAESRPSSYHIEARIAASHATSPSFDATDWPRILSLYDQLLLEKDTPEVRLNRIMAIHFAVGPEPALSALDAAFAEKSRRGFMYEAVHADLLLALGDRPGALEGWRRASRLAPTGGDRRFVQKKLEEVARGDVPRGPSPAS